LRPPGLAQPTNQVKQAYYALLRTQSALAAIEENLKFRIAAPLEEVLTKPSLRSM